jgi:hypothetical protein
MTRPVFIIGSPRSGTSILTWSLGQHPNLYPLEETVWMGRFGREAGTAYEVGSSRDDRSQLSAMGIGRETFFRSLGESIDRLILDHRFRPERPVTEDTPFALVRRPEDPKERWVDGTPENSCFVDELGDLFPEAQFIFLLRDAGSVARSLANFDQIGGEALFADEACGEWLRHIKPCAAAEQALPAHRIMRLWFGDLENAPENAVRRCLEFLDEPWSDDCLKPLAHRINSSPPRDPDVVLSIEETLLTELYTVCGDLGLDEPDGIIPRKPDDAQ